MSIKKKSFFWGSVASLTMTVFYLIIMFLTMAPREVWLNFSELWYLIVGIIIGFGVQIGLWVYVKNDNVAATFRSPEDGNLKVSATSSGVPAASGAVSGTAMVACCAHHLADVLPILGLSGAAIFLTQYQKPFLVLGLSINLLGIAYMVYLVQKHKIITNAYE